MDSKLIESLRKPWFTNGCAALQLEAAAQGEADNARIAQAVAFFNDIKQEALTAGAPGQRTSAKAFAHIVRLCIDARAILERTEHD